MSFIFSSMNWLLIWMGFELNLISFMPLLLNNFSNSSSSSAIKYFLVQASGSVIILMSIGMMTSPSSLETSTPILFLFAILLKMGSAPSHLWLPHVINNTSWFNIFLILTLQKLAPILILLKIFNIWSNHLVLFLSVANGLSGSLGGLNQTSFKGILVYSSIAHLGWIFASLNNWSISLSYFSIYSLILFLILYPISAHSFKNTFSLNLETFNNLSVKSLIYINLLSLAGLPPLLGFFPKWIVLMNINFIPLMFILTTLSLINLFFYSSIVFSNSLNSISIQSYNSPLFILIFSPNILLPCIFLI